MYVCESCWQRVFVCNVICLRCRSYTGNNNMHVWWIYVTLSCLLFSVSAVHTIERERLQALQQQQCPFQHILSWINIIISIINIIIIIIIIIGSIVRLSHASRARFVMQRRSALIVHIILTCDCMFSSQSIFDDKFLLHTRAPVWSILYVVVQRCLLIQMDLIGVLDNSNTNIITQWQGMHLSNWSTLPSSTVLQGYVYVCGYICDRAI